ncbi:MAG: protein translocase subunit SecD [Prevotella sp.]|nr:protein translocase subunit SecD [Prevotella sp.]MCM1075469.1 protein translocase subunit SecD [Ruminococcus sp.]
MQNKGFIGTIAVLLILICGFYISFSFVSSKYEKQADEYAAKIAKTTDAANKKYTTARKEYMDSLAQEKVYLGYTLAQVRQMEIGLGLDLKGGMNLVLEVPTTDIIRNMAKDEAALNKINDAIKKILPDGEFTTAGVKPSDKDFINKFADQFAEGQLTTLFAREGEFMGKLKGNSSNKEVSEALAKQVDSQVDDAFNIFRNRIDKFGVVSPNIQKLQDKTGQILLELPGVKDPDEMSRILQSSANLEFYEVYNFDEIAGPVNQLSQVTAPTDKKDKDLITLLGGGGYAGSPVVGLIARDDTAKVNRILESEEAARLLPDDLKLVWENKPVSESDLQRYKKPAKSKFFHLVALRGEPQLEGDAIVGASSEHDNLKGEVVNMEMSDEGANRWSAVTKANLGRSIAIVLDENVYSYPTVNSQITGGRSEITGNFTPEEANDLANLLKSGKMDVQVHEVSKQVIGPSLGAQAIEAGFTSFIVALVLLMIFMICFYGVVPGLVANIGLILNLFFTLGILASLQAVLTLSGIAGIVLALGMAVDANVLIFERTKEELKAGKKLRQAISDGYGNAFSAIFDGNLTSIITGVILLLFGSGPIKGFATTLIIGLVCSFFTAVFLTRIAFDLITKNGRCANMTFATGISRKIFGSTKINFIGKSKGAMIIWAALVVVSVASLSFRGMNQGIDFSGGRNYVVAFQKDVNTEEIRGRLNDTFSDAAKSHNLDPNVAVSVITIDNNQKVRISTNYRIAEGNDQEVDAEIGTLLYKALKPELTVNGKVMSEEDFNVANEELGIVSAQKVGASVADDMRTDAMLAVGIAVICMFLYILIRFHNVAFSVGAVCAVAMTAFLIIGFYSICWGFLPFSMEIDQSFIAAVLTIIGYQINDTVVVFDRVREMLKLSPKEDKTQLFNGALNATLTRTVMTSVSTLLVLLCIFILGGDTIRSFTFAMIFGVAVGTFCSLFLAAPVAYKIMTRKPKAKVNAAVKPAGGTRLSRG